MAAARLDDDDEPPPYLDPRAVAQFGRFIVAANPWTRIGGNCVPILPGGKAPAVAGWGKSGARWHSEDSEKIPAEQYHQWHAQFRDCNAAVFPATVGAMVVDVDNIALLGKVIEAVGDTPYRVQSGRADGGVHLWYAGTTRSGNGIVPGVDVKSQGGYVITPGSIHGLTGLEYRASDELLRALTAGALTLPKARTDWRQRLQRVASGVRDPNRLDLSLLADQLGSKPKSRTIGRALRAVANGKPFAEPGQRDGVLFTLLAELARYWPDAETNAIVRLFEPSARVMEAEADVDIPIVDAIRTKWDRIAGDRGAELDAADERADRLRMVAWSWVGENSAEQAHLGDPVVVHQGRTYYVRVGEHWAGPWCREDFSADVIASLCSLYGINSPDMPALLAGFGQRVRRVEYSLTARSTTFADGVLVVSVAAPRSDLEPEYSALVEIGMHRLAGDWYPQLRRWVAGLTRSELPCRALVLSGAKGTGKSLLLDGLARIWPGGAAQMRHVVGKRFNESILESPFAVADDDSSPAESGLVLAAYLRQAVSDRVQKVERKFHDMQRVLGCMRFAVATNDALQLVQGAVSYKLNDESIAAFADRLLHVPVQLSAIGWWGDNPGALVDGDIIARHALWLGLQIEYAAPSERFWVGPADTSLQTLATLSSGLRGDILLRLHELVRGGQTVGGSGVDLNGSRAIVGTGRFFDAWVTDVPKGANRRSVGLALRALAAASGASGASQPARTAQQRQHAVSLSLIDWYASYCGY